MKQKEQIAEKVLVGVLSIRQYMSRPAEYEVRSVLNPGYFFLLSALEESGGMSMSEVAQMMLISKQQATQVTGRLVDSGYIKRKTDAKDRRIINVMVTQKGRTTLTECMQVITQMTMEKLNMLSDEDTEKLDNALDVLLSTMEKVYGDIQQVKPSQE